MPCLAEDLARRFLAREIPMPEWTHEAHLMVGTWHVHTYGPDDALIRLRDGIRRLNDSHGTPNSETRGYHETITRAYVVVMAAFLSRCPAELSVDERARVLVAGPIAARDFLLRFYSKERLMSTAARMAWQEPDIMPLDLPDDCVPASAGREPAT